MQSPVKWTKQFVGQSDNSLYYVRSKLFFKRACGEKAKTSLSTNILKPFWGEAELWLKFLGILKHFILSLSQHRLVVVL